MGSEKTALGNVLDASVRDLEPDARVGQLAIDVLESWLLEGGALEVVVPRRVSCSRCDGGGCDACGRSGAIKLEEDEATRTILVTLSPSETASARRVRLVRPFGDEGGLEQLLLELRPATAPSTDCRPVTIPSRAAPLPTTMLTYAVILGILLVLAAVLTFFMQR